MLLAGNGADRQRYVAERDGLPGLVAWLGSETAALPAPSAREKRLGAGPAGTCEVVPLCPRFEL